MDYIERANSPKWVNMLPPNKIMTYDEMKEIWDADQNDAMAICNHAMKNGHIIKLARNAWLSEKELDLGFFIEALPSQEEFIVTQAMEMLDVIRPVAYGLLHLLEKRGRLRSRRPHPKGYIFWRVANLQECPHCGSLYEGNK